MLNINFHNTFGIKIKNPPNNIRSLLKEEFYNFVTKNRIQENIILDYKKKIILPSNIITLKNNLYYHSETKTFYLVVKKKILSYNLISYFKNKIYINVEVGFNDWFVLYAIENTLYFLMGRKKYCMLHASGIKKNAVAELFLGPQGSGKTLHALDKIAQKYSFLSDEYIFINKDAKCLSFPRAINFKRFHNNHYKFAFNYFWNNKDLFFKIKFFIKAFIKLILLKSNWRPMIRLRVGKVYPKVKIIKKTKINKVIFNFKKNNKIYKTNNILIFSKIILRDIQFEMKNRIISFFNYIFIPKDQFIRKVISDIKLIEKNKIKIINSFLYKILK